MPRLVTSHPTVGVAPPWPAAAYTLACTRNSTQDLCDRLGRLAVEWDCAEPERETQEVLTSFLLGCSGRAEGCRYVDVGCNLGYFAAAAAALGAAVDCYEPAPFFIDAIRETVAINRFEGRLNAVHAAVMANAVESTPTRTAVFGETYTPCGIGVRERQQLLRQHYVLVKNNQKIGYEAPAVSIRSILHGRNVTLLKIDIDTWDGALLGAVVDSLRAGHTRVDSILVEMGGNSGFQACEAPENARRKWCQSPHMAARADPSPRGGSVMHVHTLQHELGYTAWRTNTHTNREIYDRHGMNANRQMSPQQKYFEPFQFVRAMRKVERLSRATPMHEYSTLLKWSQSLLFTREALLEERGLHHPLDLEYAAIGTRPHTLAVLNNLTTESGESRMRS